MAGNGTIYRVKQGDCISSIAETNGFFWQTLWDLNPGLRKRRSDPNILLPGDELIIPELRVKEESGATETRHRFVKRGVPVEVRLVIENNGIPLANKDYILVIDGTSNEGATDGDGLLVQSMPPNAREATLKIDGLTFSFTFGAIDPVAEATGVQSRLQNLGFYDGKIDGDIGPLTTQAIAEFQAFAGIEGTGELDEETRQQLLARHDRVHEAVENTAEEPEEEDSSQSGEEEDDEDQSDGDSPDENESFPDNELQDVDDESDEDGGV